VELILKSFPFILNVLKGLGVIKDPQEEKEYRLRLLELASQKDLAASQEFVDFLKATSPASADTPRWINGLQAATRPLLTWIVMGSIISAFFVDGVSARVTLTLEAFSRAGTAGLLFLIMPAWWFLGRSVERIVPGLALLREGNGNGNGSKPAAPQPQVSAAQPAQPAAPFTSKTGFKPGPSESASPNA